MNKNESGLQWEDVQVGDGALAERGAMVQVHYTGWLFNDGELGEKFEDRKSVV